MLCVVLVLSCLLFISLFPTVKMVNKVYFLSFCLYAIQTL